MLIPVVILASMLLGCGDQCAGVNPVKYYGFEASFDPEVRMPIGESEILEIKVYWTPFGRDDDLLPIVYCISGLYQPMVCTEGGHATVEDGMLRGVTFASDALSPDDIFVVIESRPSAVSGPVTLIGQGAGTLEYEQFTHEINCTDGETQEIERAAVTVQLEP